MSAKTKKYTKEELNEVKKLIKNYYDEFHKDSKIVLNSDPKNYEHLANAIKTGDNTVKDSLDRYICDIYNEVNWDKNKHIKEIELIESFIKIKLLITTSKIDFDFYIYYYFSHKRVVKPALMKIAKKNGEWSDDNGELIYYSDDKTEKTYSLKKMDEVMNHSDTEPQVAFFKAVEKTSHKVNFFTINVNGTSLEERNIMFITYSVVETKKDLLSCGYGILIRQESEDEAKNKIINTKVDDWIVNALHDKKMSFTDFEHETYEDQTELEKKHTQYEASKYLSSFYCGYFLRKEKLDISGQQGRVVKTILEIQKSGLAFLYYDSTFKELGKYEPRYKGFLYFPKGDYTQIKGSFTEKIGNPYRYYLLLDSNKTLLKGILSGWSRSGEIYSTPICFNRIIPKNDEFGNEIELTIESIIDEYDPKRIKKADLIKDIELIKELRESIFPPLFEKYINGIEDCIPEQ